MQTETSSLLIVLLGSIAGLAISGSVSLVAGKWAKTIGLVGAVAACFAGFAAAVIALACRVSTTITMPWSMPYGSFCLGIDMLGSFFLVPIFLLCGLAAAYASEYFHPWSGKSPGRFWFFYNLLAASMALVVLARNGVLFLTAWEAMSLASFFLVIYDDEEPGTQKAGWTYLVATHAGTAFLLVLFLILGKGGGGQDFGSYAVPSGSAGLLFALALVGFGTKAGLFPLHVWLPEAHPAAPSPVSSVMSGVMIKTGIYGILRTLAIVGVVPAWCAWIALVAGAATGVFGIMFALAQKDLKRMLAYSSVENIGIACLALGLGMLGVQRDAPVVALLGFAGALLHVMNHALFKGLLFFGAGAVVHSTGTRNLERLGGLFKRMPWTGATFFIGAAAICGLPPFNGFAGEFLIYAGAFNALPGDGVLALAGIMGLASLALIGGLAAAAFTRAFGIAFLGEPRTTEAAQAHESGLAMRLPMIALAAACLLIGLFPGMALRAIMPIAASFIGGDEWVSPSCTNTLGPVGFAGFGLLALAGGLAWLRHKLLAGRTAGETVTWDCGYAAPAASMQYTATGYAQPLTHGAAGLLGTTTRQTLPKGVYPAAASCHVDTPDLAGKRLYAPLFAAAGKWMANLSWLQQGRVHIYVLYVVVVLMVLLAWAVRS